MVKVFPEATEIKAPAGTLRVILLVMVMSSEIVQVPGVSKRVALSEVPNAVSAEVIVASV